MTTDRPVAGSAAALSSTEPEESRPFVSPAPLSRPSPEVIAGPDGYGEWLRRLRHRRRLVKEELLAVLALFVMLAVTVALLATQWLSNSSTHALSHLIRFIGGAT
ncbi:MAG: hypothetical protein JO337_10385 [Acidimicrobiales bacterium]|nr:hypothetical protein [Acidimicrobiales bacterium]